ncbi:FIP1[V]-like protein isoform X2 [Mercurialis annua]|uniref:FIP1[V]-like protein isoform X2 n=1 Tax=Mercurialis annua TaxID=3986 RepID=UPI00216092F0|nr:FIP1[V]-like protein isoform X2 [Mercurialis annua]
MFLFLQVVSFAIKYVRPGAAPMPGAPAAGPGGVQSQVRPPINMAPIAGRGRGDWRPAGMKNAPGMQKGYHPGFGMPWGNNMAGRGFGSGLEFTLPSHKTIFDVDIDSFEEKPWKYPGVDMSDFFNFGLNEDSWKDYCKQLEQHRLETTMQSKIRVYESGRAEQEYDPDMPPELAAAAGMHDISVENSNFGKCDALQSDLTKGLTRMRPPLPTGRAIQVEGGYGERLPSIDTRPPRNRDSDAIIEIVLQDSLDDDSSTGNGGMEGANNDMSRDEFRASPSHENDMARIETDCYNDGFPLGYNGRKAGRRAPFSDPARNNVPDGDGMVPFHPKAPSQHHLGSRGRPDMLPGEDFGPADDERRSHVKTDDNSTDSTPNRGAQDKRFIDNVEEESVESMDGKHSPLVLSSKALRDARELSAEDKDAAVSGKPVSAELSSGMEGDEMTENDVTTKDGIKDGDAHHSMKKQKLISHGEPSALRELDDREDSKAAKSSENSKARSGSSKDYQKWQDDVEEEVVQDGRPRHTGSMKRHVDDYELNLRRKESDARQEMERTYMVRKGREGSYPHRDLDPSFAHHPHAKNEVYDRRKERENSDGGWLRREEDFHGRKGRPEDTRKRERVEEMASRHKSKVRDGDRSDKEEHLHSRKQLDNGSYRIHHDKDGSSRRREREDSLKIRHDIADDYHNKRRKDEEFVRRDHADKEDNLHGHRETISRRRRERNDVLDPRKRDDHLRVRDGLDDYHSARHKEEVWLPRERGERQRERDGTYRLKQPHEENLSKREKEEGRGTAKTGRGTDDKAWINHSGVKDEYRSSEKEYQLKDAVRNSEHQKGRDRVEDDGFSHHRGRDDVYARANQFSNEERRSRQERSSIRVDRAVDSPDNQRVHERKHKDNIRKNKESEGGDHSTLGSSRRNQDQIVHSSEMGIKGPAEQGNGKNDISTQRNSSKRHKEDVSSDEEQQGRGRSKLERWTSHKERDYSINNKASASLKSKEVDRNNNSKSAEANKPPEEQPKRLQAVEKPEVKDTGDVENKDSETKPVEDRHLDTVEKLKKRSERFKLPMPSEKDVVAVKKMENEPLPSVKSDTPVNLEIKPERPTRKRRWISS